ncbi:MAG: hypothetical protein WA991_15475 [Ornithinimicrobium sp.]
MRWVPTVIWAGTLRPWVTPEDIEGRACTSLLLAHIGSMRPWRLIAIDLGLPASFARYPPSFIRRLKHKTQWDAYLTALEELASTLEHSPPAIDYQERRWLTRDPNITNAALDQALKRSTVRDGRRLRSAIVARYLASDVTFLPTRSGGSDVEDPVPVGEPASTPSPPMSSSLWTTPSAAHPR